MSGSNEQDSGIKLTTKHFALRISYEAFQVALRTFISLILLVTLGYPMRSVSHCERSEYGTQGYGPQCGYSFTLSACTIGHL
jgi:hypothetical protein